VTADKTFASINPATGEVIGHAPDTGVEEAGAAARRAFDNTRWPTVVIAFDDDDDAVRIANNSIYGLAGAVFSRDQDRALAVARRIRTGSFYINGRNYFGADSPFGGFKQSGVGREMGVAGLEEFLERKTFAVPAVGGQG
jgi:acyl-CoA reductase-like NAD-dependent aldehyde dehydrogenase